MSVLGAALVFGTLFATFASARGFDSRYELFAVDANGDGREDVFVTRKPQQFLIPLGDLPIPLLLPADVKDFVLLNNGNGTFRIVPPGPGIGRHAVSSYLPLADDALSETVMSVRDVDQDGLDDLELTSFGVDIPGAMGVIVYADEPLKSLPTRTTTMTPKFERFHSDLGRWSRDRSYFARNTFQRVVGGARKSNLWFASTLTDSPAALRQLSMLHAACESRSPGFQACGVSTTPPDDCMKDQQLVDGEGNLTSRVTRNVCSDPLHLYVFEASDVQLALDATATDADAREAAEVLETFVVDGCLVGDAVKSARLNRIIDFIFGPVTKLVTTDILDNTIPHPPFPGDSGVSRSDRTFHHYDADTRICKSTESGCTKTRVEEMLRSRWSYPTRFLFPTTPPPRFDGVERRDVFVTPPGLSSSVLAYFVYAGPITQTILTTAGFHEGAVRNKTEDGHKSFPGFISRLVLDKADGMHVFTHGTGVNRFLRPASREFCSLEPLDQFNGVNIVFAFLNDLEGPKVFRQLDRQIVKEFRNVVSVETPVETEAAVLFIPEAPCCGPNRPR